MTGKGNKTGQEKGKKRGGEKRKVKVKTYLSLTTCKWLYS